MKKILEWIKKLWERCHPGDQKHRIIRLASIVGALAAVIVAAIVIALSGSKESVVYKETQVVKGNLAAGVTETGSVDVGTTTQSFDLDISEFTESTSFSWGTGGGMDMMMGINSQSSTGSSSGTRQLEIEEVYVEAGQEIAQGDPLLKLTKQSVESIRTELAEDVTAAQIVYQQAETASQQTQVEAQADYELNILYQTYAQSQYSQTLTELEDGVTQKEEELESIQEALEKAQSELEEKKALLAEEKQVLENAVYTATGSNREDSLYWWVIAWQTKAEAEELAESLEDEIEQLQEEIEEDTAQEASARLELELAKKELEVGETEAKGQLSLHSYQAQNAQEIYDVAVEQGNFDMEIARQDYEEAQQKLNEFDEVIVEQIIYASSGGLVTDVMVAAGDTLTQDMELISFNDYNDVTITLSVEDDDMEAAALGNQVNIVVAAFPEEVFTGTVTEIGDAEIDSNTNKTLYSVTVTVNDTTDLLYQDMTAEVTFVTDQISEVLYIPNRGITEEGDTSYVKVKMQDGSIETRQVTTGFTDGIHTEIKEGLSEGETVLLESRVS